MDESQNPTGEGTTPSSAWPESGWPADRPVHPSPAGPAAAPPPPAPPPRRRRSIFALFFQMLGIVFFLMIAFVVIGLWLMTHRGGDDGVVLTDKIGLLRIEGEIGQQKSIPYSFWLDTLKKFGETRKIRGVVIRINSPGGAVGSSQELQKAVADLRDKWDKPVYISMADMAASGGYYIASAGDRVYALKGSLTGSIGVIFNKPDISGLTQKIGIQTEVVKSGKFKDAGSEFRPMTDDEKFVFGSLITDSHKQFLDDVLARRGNAIKQACEKIAPEKWAEYRFQPVAEPSPRAFLEQIADGRVYTGEQALELGLVDQIGTLNDVIAAMGQKLGWGVAPAIYEPQPTRSWQEMLTAKVGDILPAAHVPLQYMMSLP